MADAWGGSWGDSWGDSWGAGAATAEERELWWGPPVRRRPLMKRPDFMRTRTDAIVELPTIRLSLRPLPVTVDIGDIARLQVIRLSILQRQPTVTGEAAVALDVQQLDLQAPPPTVHGELAIQLHIVSTGMQLAMAREEAELRQLGVL